MKLLIIFQVSVDSSESKNSNIRDIRNEMQKSMQKYASVYKSEDAKKGYTKIKVTLNENINIKEIKVLFGILI